MKEQINVQGITDEQRKQSYDVNGTPCTLEEIIFQSWVNPEPEESPTTEDLKTIANLDIGKTYWLEFAGEYIKRIK